MLTMFSTPKPFRGHAAVIQRNALRSWALLHPDVEIILFGDDEGTAEVCRELRLRHEAHVERNEFGAKVLSYIFDRAQQIARHDYVCYSNCDIILPSTFSRALRRLTSWRKDFMMVGRRWDVDITGPIDFETRDWDRRAEALAGQHGMQRSPEWIDYFAFRRGLCQTMLPFSVGYAAWDPWLVWKMCSSGVPVVDASRAVMAIHQNHDYSHHPQGTKGVREGREFQKNRALAGSWRHLYTIADASHVLESGAVRRTYRHWGLKLSREIEHARNTLFAQTGPLRHRLGLRRKNMAHLFRTGRV